MIASRHRFADPATESRTITHDAYRTNRLDIPITLDDDFENEAEYLCNRLPQWREEHYDLPLTWDDEFLALDIEPRLKEVLSPLSTVLPESEWPWLREFALKANRRIIDERKISLEYAVVASILRLMESDIPLTMKNVAQGVTYYDTKWWSVSPRKVGYITRRVFDLDVQRQYQTQGYAQFSNPYTIVASPDNLKKMVSLAVHYGVKDASSIRSITSITSPRDQKGPNLSKIHHAVKAIADYLDKLSVHGHHPLELDHVQEQIRIYDSDLQTAIEQALYDQALITADDESITVNMAAINRLLGKTEVDKIFNGYDRGEL